MCSCRLCSATSSQPENDREQSLWGTVVVLFYNVHESITSNSQRDRSNLERIVYKIESATTLKQISSLGEVGS